MIVRKLLWTLAIGLGAAAVYVVVREACCEQHEGDPVGYAGNETSAVFHRLGCRLFHPTEASPGFATRAQALEAGYRPCGVCRP